MIISILCVDKKFGIGKNNTLLFSLPKDMAFFRSTTLNHVVAMGENTLLSFPNSKPLKNRTNIVLSGNVSHNYEGVINVHTFQDFLNKIKEYNEKEDVYIIGGASIYHQMLPYVDKVLLTKVDADGEATLFFDNLDESPDFELKSVSEPVLDGDYSLTFNEYVNINKKSI